MRSPGNVSWLFLLLFKGRMSRSWNVSLLFTFALLLLLLLIVFQHYMDAVINRLKMTSVFRSAASHVCKLQFVVLTFYRYSWYSDTVLPFVRASEAGSRMQTMFVEKVRRKLHETRKARDVMTDGNPQPRQASEHHHGIPTPDYKRSSVGSWKHGL